MQISSRFTLAIHIFACVDTFKDDYKVTSDFIAGSTNVNPVIIRKILGQLKAAGLIEVARGTGGTTIAKPLLEITFLDIYRAVECVEENQLFHFHENPNTACPVGRNIGAGAEGDGAGIAVHYAGGCQRGFGQISGAGKVNKNHEQIKKWDFTVVRSRFLRCSVWRMHTD